MASEASKKTTVKKEAHFFMAKSFQLEPEDCKRILFFQRNFWLVQIVAAFLFEKYFFSRTL